MALLKWLPIGSAITLALFLWAALNHSLKKTEKIGSMNAELAHQREQSAAQLTAQEAAYTEAIKMHKAQLQRALESEERANEKRAEFQIRYREAENSGCNLNQRLPACVQRLRQD